jgi:uncharacterized membrane protein
MQHLLEILLGLKQGFLSQEGRLSIQFNPTWPWQDYLGGAVLWNLILIAAAIALIVYVYRRESKSPRARILLGTIRGSLLILILILLNRPLLTLSQAHKDPSVLALLIDDSVSMKIQDVTSPDGQTRSRLDAITDLLTNDNSQLLKRLAAVHQIRLYEFDRGPRLIAQAEDANLQPAETALANLQPTGDQTQVVTSVRSVLEDLQGQRVAGIVVFTDGRETPAPASRDQLAAVKAYGDKIYAVPVGSDQLPRMIAVQSVSFEPAAFVDDVTDFKITLRATGYELNHPIVLRLMKEVQVDGKTVRIPVQGEFGQPISKTVTAPDNQPFEAELQYKPTETDMPNANLVVEAVPQPGEVDDTANYRKLQLAVLDDKISVLYVDGYPRWDYRYLKNSLLRDHTVKVSCLLTSADPDFRQEGSDDPTRPGGTWAITAFPSSIDQLMDYDVIILGDVDPREFTDAQLQLISDFVSKKGGGFAMIAGPRWSPQAYRDSPIESVLPVNITHTQPDDFSTPITEGFRPVVTDAGSQTSIFRFFADPASNDEFLKNHLQEIFWYCRGVTVKPGVGIVYAEHPTDLGPDNRRAPILVAGRFGAGRTIFSAIDDSWRWRYYTGESIFNTYWVQQLRYLARGRKLGQRGLIFTSDEDSYELGHQVTLRVRLLSPDLLQQASDPLLAQITDDATGEPVRQVQLSRQGIATDVYTGSYTADRAGTFSAKLLQFGNAQSVASYNIQMPQLELDDPRVDIAGLSRLATEEPIPFDQAAQKLPTVIHSAARIFPIEASQPLWNAPLALLLFALLITTEWVVRKMLGML